MTDIRVVPDPPRPLAEPGDELGLGDLVRRLADDGRSLLRQEIALAKLELRESVISFARGSLFLAVGLLLLGVGMIVLLVFVILALGGLLDGQYWLSTLIVGASLAALGAILLLVGKRRMARGGLKPEHAIASARDTKDWAAHEARQLKNDLAR